MSAQAQLTQKAEKYNALKEARLCVKCGGPRSANGTKVLCPGCAGRNNARTVELRRRRIAEGLCRCGGLLENGKLSCSRCLDRLRERYQHRIAEGLCRCGEPRGEDGTRTMCAQCAAKALESRGKTRQRRIESGDCPLHGVTMSVLECCPACLYERPGGQISDLTFEGLLPPPSSGDKLESCVGCKRCDRRFHKGSSYASARIPHDLKLRDEHVGKDGNGIWLLFSQGDGEGVPVKYERCSTPEKECVGKGKISRRAAMNYLALHRRGEEILGACHKHAHGSRFLVGIAEARLLQQNATTSIGQGEARIETRGRKPKITEEKIRAAYKKLGDYAPQEKLAEQLGVDARALRDWQKARSLTYLQLRQQYADTGRN